MKLRDRISNLFKPTAQNATGRDLASQFLRYGGTEKPLGKDWAQLSMSDRDLYSGYTFAAIRNRANRVAQLATENILTDAEKKIMDAAKAKKEQVVHPYLETLDNSPTFSNYMFWYTVSTYLDLEGVFYLMAIRAVGNDRLGTIKEFKLLNPYDIQPVINRDSLEIGGYVENRKGFQREIPKEMIIDMRDLNPFDWQEPLALTDAAKESQFTMKQAGDYTRYSLKNNIAAPGIISTGIVLEDQQFENFKARIKSQQRGEPLFANGPGVIDYQSMQTELDRAGLDKITAMSLEQLIAVTGVSKTTFGIEQSGVTRDTSKTQSDLFVVNQIIPRLQTILDAMNQDYKNFYPKEYEANNYRLYIDSPLGTDRDAELSDIEIRNASLELYQTLINKGYERDVASRYAMGEITLEELGEPKNPPVNPLLPPTDPNNPNDPNANPKDGNPPPPPPKKSEKKPPAGKGEQGAVTHDLGFTDLNEEGGGNPNHDKRGRFTTGPGGSKYPGRKEGESYEAYAYRYLKENPKEATAAYKKRIVENFDTDRPNVVSADDVKHIIPGFNPERSTDYHEPGSAFVKEYYRSLLSDSSTGHLPVLFTAGGTGAGKSTALRGQTGDFGSYAAIYDGNMAGFSSAVGKIDYALKTGRTVQVVYVDRNPFSAYKFGVLPRIGTEGRLINITTHVSTHLESRKAVAQIAKYYRSNPNVTVKLIDNNGALHKQFLAPLSNLTQTRYNKDALREKLLETLKGARDNGEISEGVYQVAKNSGTTPISGTLDAGELEETRSEETGRDRELGLGDGQELTKEAGNPYHDKIGRFATGPGTGVDLTQREDFDDIAFAAYDRIENWRKGSKGDPGHNYIVKQQKFDKKPKLVTSDEIDAMVDQGTHVELYRGLYAVNLKQGAEYTESFKSGELYSGLGVLGSGTYSSTKASTAFQYGDFVLHMAIPKAAKIISDEDISSQAVKFIDNVNIRKDIALRAISDKKKGLSPINDRPKIQQLTKEFEDTSKRYDYIKWFAMDNGRFAAAKGYDAIRDSSRYGEHHYVIMNRGVLSVEK